MSLFGSVGVLVVLCFIFSFGVHPSTASDRLIPGQSLSGNQTLTSPAAKFELGFFTRGNSNNYYIGIWYAKLLDHTVVWVANRDRPVSDPVSSEFKFLLNGNFTLLDQSNFSIWSTQTSMSLGSKSATAVLLDNGNFVIRDASDDVIWQSFDHPTDTWLPGGARLGYNKITNQNVTLTPWKNPQDPAPGIFALEVDPNGTSFWLLYNGSLQYWNSGPWNGKSFAQVPENELNDHIANVSFVSDDKGRYVSYDVADPDTYVRYMIDTDGQFKAYLWGKDFAQWNAFWLRPTQFCEVYGFCGASSLCLQNVSQCVCLEGYEPRAPEEWGLGVHTDGCVRQAPLQCTTGVDDTFEVLSNVRLPVKPETLAVDDIDECRLGCLRNCSCTAFAFDNGCFVWAGDLFNVKQFTADEKEGKDLHLKVPAYERIEGKKENKTLWIVIGVVGGLFIVITIVVVLFLKHRYFGERFDILDGSLVMFRYRVLRKATNNFSEKLGEGGFGSVFKGTLQGSIAIAVKRLNCPKQEDKQFFSEVRTIGKVQHINLIRLCGFCAEASKRFLVYEYMPNGSLESVLFKKSSIVLDWKTRYHIAIGTARGLAYLHEECRECIIHCDIKPENILLDAEYVPKVADFGLAKLIDRDISRIITTLKGTRGYIAPEWISGEAITSKADVFSYGMLLFELISGKRNRDLLDNGLENYFPIRVANVLNKEEDVDTLLDYKLEGNVDKDQLSRACSVACWCIQDDEKDRPTMGQVVQYLEGVIVAEIPPMPKFLDRFSQSLVESINYRYITSSSSDSCRHEYSNCISQT